MLNLTEKGVDDGSGPVSVTGSHLLILEKVPKASNMARTHTLPSELDASLMTVLCDSRYVNAYPRIPNLKQAKGSTATDTDNGLTDRTGDGVNTEPRTTWYWPKPWELPQAEG